VQKCKERLSFFSFFSCYTQYHCCLFSCYVLMFCVSVSAHLCTCVFVCVCLMIFDYNKLLVKRSNIVVYSSLQSPLLAAPDRGCVHVGVCVYYIITHLVACRDRIVAPVSRMFSFRSSEDLPPRTTISFFRKVSSGSPGLRSIRADRWIEPRGGGFCGTPYSSRVRSRHFSQVSIVGPSTAQENSMARTANRCNNSVARARITTLGCLY